MHPILTRPERLALYLGAWVVVGILIAGVLNRQGLTFAEALVLVLPLFLAYSFVCLSAWYVCRAVPLRSSGVLQVLVACITSSVVASGIWLALAYAWIAVFDSMPALADMAARDRQQIPLLFAAAVLMFLLALAVTYLGLAFEEAREAEQRQYELEAHARNAELRALRAQLDPHFLYNCLNSIAALTSADPAARAGCACCWRNFSAARCMSVRCRGFRLATNWRWPTGFWPSNRSALASASRSRDTSISRRSRRACRHCFFSRWSRTR